MFLPHNTYFIDLNAVLAIRCTMSQMFQYPNTEYKEDKSGMCMNYMKLALDMLIHFKLIYIRRLQINHTAVVVSNTICTSLLRG